MFNKFINLIESSQLKSNIPFFKVGYLIEVKLWINEGKKKRIQNFEGLVIAKKNRGLNSSFTVRKISHGEGIERVFKSHSPLINNIVIKNIYKTKKAKLYFLRILKKETFNILNFTNTSK